LNAAFHFPHPAFLEERHEVPLADGVREVGINPIFHLATEERWD
jgi:hypothetical protein